MSTSDSAALAPSRIIQACYGGLQRFARRRLSGAPAAEDLVQEACLRFASTEPASLANPRAFLYRILANLVLDHQRRQRRAPAVAVIDDGAEPADAGPDAERVLIARQQLALLVRAVEELPPRCRECFVMRRFEDLPQEEIARRMGISRNMVEKHLRAAALHCANRLRESG